MSTLFSTIGIMGKHTHPEAHKTLIALVTYLEAKGIDIIVEQNYAQLIPELAVKKTKAHNIAALCDLILVIGGDGSLLNAARTVVDNDVPVIGINRGRRGFLTDISPQTLTDSLEPILRGEYQEEHRFLLEMELWRDNQLLGQGTALNDVVIYSGDISRMMDFQVYINQQFVYRQRSDGLITATPTGSTAHALAGGGPIVHPSLDAIALVPMHPSMLSSRPIVVDSRGLIELYLMSDSILRPRISCDGQVHFDAKPEDKIVIRRKAKELRLLHPTDYDFYHILRTKLGWSA